MNIRQYIRFTFLLILCVAGACSPKIPEGNVTDSEERPAIFPDYTDVVVPPNIAPLNFEILDDGEEYVSRIKSDSGDELTAGGRTAEWKIDDWHRLLEANRGKSLELEIYVTSGDGSVIRKKSRINVASEDIDPYFSYRLIEPSYEIYDHISLEERNLTNFESREIFNNRRTSREDEMSCMNCHVPRNQYRDGKAQFHIRKHQGGTLLMDGDKVERVAITSDSGKAGVYQAWHPGRNHIAYSTNGTRQYFHTGGKQKVEVLDEWSDIILYDMERKEVITLAGDSTLFETFPAWNHDGSRLYYSVAPRPDGPVKENYDSIRYDIVSRAYNPRTRQLTGDADTVLNASAMGKSASLPRISPDGRFLLTCVGDYGTFHIWHKSSDLWLTDLMSGESRPLDEANSEDVDSYHSWSSNSRWVIFSSRRDDGSYTRPYITYIDRNGNASKAFLVPQENPRYYRMLMKSYNVPEFMTGPVKYSRKAILDALEREPVTVTHK